MDDSGGFGGRQIGRYLLHEMIGQGAMSFVYRASDTKLESYQMKRDVAFKIMSPQLTADLKSKSRIKQEAQILLKLAHPNIVPVYDFGEDQGIYYIVMPLFNGSVETRLDQRPLLSHEAVKVLDQLAAALDYLHSQSVIHRDIKPSNVLCDLQGNVYLADFGIAKILNISNALTKSGQIVGTPSYMAPELWRYEDASPSSDIYALGILMYRALSGLQPFEADSQRELMRKHRFWEPTPLHQLVSDISPAIETTIAIAMKKDPNQRYHSATGFAQAFHEALNVSSKAPTAILTAAPHTPDDKRWLALALTITGVLIGLIGLFVLFNIIVPPQPTPNSIIDAGIVSSPSFTPTSTMIESLTPTPSPTLTHTPQSLVTATGLANPNYVPVTPMLTLLPGVLTTQQPSQTQPFSWTVGDILTICVFPDQFDPFDAELEVQSPDGTITKSTNASGIVCSRPFVVSKQDKYLVTVRSANGEVGSYSLKITLYNNCAAHLPIAVRISNLDGALPAIRGNSSTFVTPISTAVPDECFAVIGESGAGWWQIQARDGRIGWIGKTLVTVIGDVEATPTP